MIIRRQPKIAAQADRTAALPDTAGVTGTCAPAPAVSPADQIVLANLTAYPPTKVELGLLSLFCENLFHPDITASLLAVCNDNLHRFANLIKYAIAKALLSAGTDEDDPWDLACERLMGGAA